MKFGLRVVAKLLLLLTSFAMYGALGALHTRGGVLTGMAIAALLVFVAILFHELAHAAAARLVGARVHAIVALPFRLRFRPLRLDLIRRGGRGDLGGYISFTLDRIAARRKHAIIAVAGPFANLVLALLAFTMASSLAPPTVVQAIAAAPAPDNAPLDDPPITHAVTVMLVAVPVTPPSPWPILLFAFAVLSGGLGLANLIPYDCSDGAQLLRLWRSGARPR